ncbi:glycosyltransferase [bacterium]|jgi:glycosyltransferase involved in cell wall biosynthesis|nr:glycosyltransferase [bacterium]
MKKLLILKGVLGLDGASNWLATYLQELDRTKYKPIVCLFVGSQKEERVNEFKKQMNCEIIEMGAPNHKISPVHFLKLFFLIKKVDPDILHISIPHLGFIARFYAKLLNIKTISTLHNVLYRFKPIVKYCETKSIHLSDEVVAVSNEVNESYSKLVDSSKLHTIDNGVNTKMFDNTKRKDIKELIDVNIDNIDKVYINVGRLHKQKAQDVLIKSFSKYIHESKSKDILLIVGQGSLYDKYKELIKEHKMEDSIYLLGPRSDIPELLLASDIFIFPSRWEGLPYALLEAMAASLPVIVSDLPQIVELIDNNGLVSEVENEESLIKCLKQYNSFTKDELLEMSKKSKAVLQEKELDGVSMTKKYTILLDKLGEANGY